MSFGREIKCPFCDSTLVTFVKMYRYKCLKCEKDFNVLENTKTLLLHESPTEVSGEETITENTIPLRIRPRAC